MLNKRFVLSLEGRVTKAPIRIKWGISRLIMESKSAPILLPIWINGMQNISPERPPYYPKIGNVCVSLLNMLSHLLVVRLVFVLILQ